MNNINIQLSDADRLGLFHREAIMLLYFYVSKGFPLEQTRDSLARKGLIKPLGLGLFELTDEGIQKILELLKTNKRRQYEEEDLRVIANRLRELFPTGRKNGTAYYWRDTEAIIMKKLKNFFLKYKYEPDQVINSAKAYVDSFNGEYRYMQLLKYFIEKDGTSQLASFIENYKQEDQDLGNNWTSSLI